MDISRAWIAPEYRIIAVVHTAERNISGPEACVASNPRASYVTPSDDTWNGYFLNCDRWRSIYIWH